ncbi:fibronectin type III domain-containing protein, partial [Desulfobulbus sp. F1]|nr:fibronectin type III domain-containing protein [Desulfobulbus sp. F1]
MATLCGWDFRGRGGQAVVPATTTAAGVSGTTAIGSGLLAVNDLKNGLVGRKQTKATLADAKTDNEYVSFKLTPAAGKALTITGVKLRPASQNRNRNFTLTANDREITTFITGTIFLPLKSIQITDIIGVAASVEFRLYIYGHTDEWESVGIGERRNGEAGLDLEVIGDVVPVPVPVNIQPPTNLAASNITASGFTLQWRESTGATSYEVFTGTTSRGTVNHTATSLNITGLAAGTYAVTVRARDAAGNVSAGQNPALNVTIPNGIYENSRSRMGINMSSVNEYNTDQPFKDLFKTARPWNDGN